MVLPLRSEGKQATGAAAAASATFRDSVLYNVDTGAGAADNERRWPIVYHGNYNILLFGIEKVHPFDSTKWGKVNEILMSKKLYKKEDIYEPTEPKDSDLLIVHTKAYLNSLKVGAATAATADNFVATADNTATMQMKLWVRVIIS